MKLSIALCLLFGLARCGGIVDNGEKEDPPKVLNDQAATTLLDRYEVDLPSADWGVRPGVAADSASVSDGTQEVVFTRGSMTCDAAPHENEHGVVLADCDAQHTLLLPQPDDPVIATFGERTPEVVTLLASFRAKED